MARKKLHWKTKEKMARLRAEKASKTTKVVKTEAYSSKILTSLGDLKARARDRVQTINATIKDLEQEREALAAAFPDEGRREYGQ